MTHACSKSTLLGFQIMPQSWTATTPSTLNTVEIEMVEGSIARITQ